jgi:hypothetical protein
MVESHFFVRVDHESDEVSPFPAVPEFLIQSSQAFSDAAELWWRRTRVESGDSSVRAVLVCGQWVINQGLGGLVG